MKISNVSTALKVGRVVLNESKSKSNLKVEWENVPSSTLKSNAGRVYLLVVDGEIKKIGGSVGKGGIKSTMSFYVSGNTGRPSIEGRPVLPETQKDMVDKCVSDYVNFTGSYPDWNYQEQAKPWEQYIQEGHAQIMTKTAAR